MENYFGIDEIQNGANIELDRHATWSKIGSDVRTATTIEDVLQQSGLDYEVSTTDIVVGATGEVIKDKFATIDSNGRYLGVVGKDFEICQNIDAFDFVNCIDDMTFVKAGETHTGMVYVIGELPSMEVFGDEIKPNVIFQNGHNGRYSIKATIVPLRIACQNQFAKAFKEVPSTISIKHCATMRQKMEEAQSILQCTAAYMNNFKAYAETMYQHKLTREQVCKIIEQFFVAARDREELSKKQNNMIDQQVAFLHAAYNAEDNQNLKGTMFGLINAYADYMTHAVIRNSRYADGKFLSTSFDNSGLDRFANFAQRMVA